MRVPPVERAARAVTAALLRAACYELPAEEAHERSEEWAAECDAIVAHHEGASVTGAVALVRFGLGLVRGYRLGPDAPGRERGSISVGAALVIGPLAGTAVALLQGDWDLALVGALVTGGASYGSRNLPESPTDRYRDAEAEQRGGRARPRVEGEK
ncbi:hypothetical protein ACFP3U_16765 [Kitasatospora misakiensis]|uniref:Uncharacterized protein n=1 Tax=Kitasatospora misakiensis TaxID=67330 RepID=A0ABW0X276_9ACTN